MIKCECTACGEDCSNCYATFKGDPYHFGCLPARRITPKQLAKIDGHPNSVPRAKLYEYGE